MNFQLETKQRSTTFLGSRFRKAKKLRTKKNLAKTLYNTSVEFVVRSVALGVEVELSNIARVKIRKKLLYSSDCFLSKFLGPAVEIPGVKNVKIF